MSGGSLDYVYIRVAEAADTVERRATTPLHRAFSAHLRQVAEALREMEWVLSGDSAEGSETILACLPKDAEQTEE